jgi:hypothetical protein
VKGTRFTLFLGLLTLATMSVDGGRSAVADQVFKIYVEHAGIYEVSYERLAEAGLDAPMPSDDLGLRNRGVPVPVWVEDGGDGFFGPGDRVKFLGEVLRGQVSYLDPFSRYNCYILSFADSQPIHGESRPASGSTLDRPAQLLAQHHLEPDRVMVRFRARPEAPEEVWYWERLSVVDREPFRQVLELEGLQRTRNPSSPRFTSASALSNVIRDEASSGHTAGGEIQSVLASVFTADKPALTTVRIRFGFRGWSEPRHVEASELPHHEVEILLNGEPVGRASWNGKDHFVYEADIAADRFFDGANTLELVVPKRTYPKSGDLLVDVVLLNWIELEYRHQPVIGREQLRLYPMETDGRIGVEIFPLNDEPVDLYLASGVRYQSSGGELAEVLDSAEAPLYLVPQGAAAAPGEVVLDRPSNLASRENQADYVMITHRSLEATLERLAEFHRRRGLTVSIVDVQDIYDEFNFGIVNPKAIKDFLENARREWRSPAPRFVLLAGDASWDFKNTTADDANYADWTYRPGEARYFVKNSSTPYAEGAELNHRNLVPTWSYPTLEGHAASDTWFVCFDDGDNLPDMAIGRLPVVSPEELDGVIDKTIDFAAGAPLGPWRRKLLFIANESVSFQTRSDQIAKLFSERGYVPVKIYPHPSEPANEHHTRRIIEELDGGVLAVHFIGHGGRYIWRTGPPDLQKNHDLFTLEHLDELAPNRRLPVVLSLTCYSAPFDHPTADSIGEKLIRIPGRGAIAVFAASWRNSPSPAMGETLLKELTKPGATIGEAVMRAKREFRSDMLVQTYNLLGDPAVTVAAPEVELDLSLERTADGLELQVDMPVTVDDGQLVADWVGGDGSTLRTDTMAVRGDDFKLHVDPASFGGEVAFTGVRVYVWDESAQVDGIGWVAAEPDLTTMPEDDAATRGEASDATKLAERGADGAADGAVGELGDDPGGAEPLVDGPGNED